MTRNEVVIRAAPPQTGGVFGAPRALSDLIRVLVVTDFRVRYYGHLGGFFWALLKPLTMMAVLLGIFSFVFEGEEYALNLVIGLFIWDFFAEGTKAGLISLHQKGYLLTKSRAPAWVFAVTASSNAVITFVIFAAGIMAYLMLDGRGVSAFGILVFAWYGFQLWCVIVGFSLFTGVIFPRLRDLNQVWDMMLQAGFFVAPIIYPLDIVPERFHLLLYLWPPTAFIEFSRTVLISGELPSLTGNLLLAGSAVLSLLCGAAAHKLMVRKSVEYL